MTITQERRIEKKFPTPSAELLAKDVFTTGDASTICKVSQQTIIRNFDNGKVKGFKVPGSKFRRIPRADLIQFMKANKLDTSMLESNRHILIIGGDENDAYAVNTELRIQLPQGVSFDFTHSLFEAGLSVAECPPRVIVFTGKFAGNIDSVTIGLDNSEILANKHINYVRIPPGQPTKSVVPQIVEFLDAPLA